MNNRKLLEKSFFFFGVTLKMEVSDDNSGFDDQLESISTSHKIFYDNLRSVKGGIVNKSLIQKSEEYLKNLDKRAERLKKAYEIFSKQVAVYCDNYVTEVNVIEEEDKNEIKELKDDFEKMKDEMEKKKDKLNKGSVFEVKEPSFYYRDYVKSRMNVELVKNYPGSYLYEQYMGKNRTADGDIYIDCDGKNDELIVKYMKEDYSLIDDLKKMNLITKEKLLDDLNFLELPIKKEFVKELGQNEDSEIMNAWRNRRVIMVNGKNANNFNILLMKYKLFDSHFNNECLKNIHYYKPNNTFYIDMKVKYYDVIEDYLKNGKMINEELIKVNSDNGDADELINEMKMIGIELNDTKKEEIRGCFDPRLLRGSTIIEDTQYDEYLKEWLGSEHKWKLIYRASENNYTGKSFHEHCDNATPTLVIIKSDNDCIFGGYTTQTWSGNGIYYHDNIMIINRL